MNNPLCGMGGDCRSSSDRKLPKGATLKPSLELWAALTMEQKMEANVLYFQKIETNLEVWRYIELLENCKYSNIIIIIDKENWQPVFYKEWRFEKKWHWMSASRSTKGKE